MKWAQDHFPQNKKTNDKDPANKYSGEIFDGSDVMVSTEP